MKTLKANIIEILAIFFSLVAIVISGYSLHIGKKQHEDLSAAETLDRLYSELNDIVGSSIDAWEVRHLDETPQTYYQTRDLIRTLTKDLSDEEKTKILLKERATANLIFISFEHHLKQWNLAKHSKDNTRLLMMQEEMDYYANLYLRNPRLLWYWSEEGGDWKSSSDPSTIEFYENQVLNNPEKPLNDQPDKEGILPNFSWNNRL